MNLFQIVFIPVCAALAIRAAVRVWRHRLPRRLGMLLATGWTVAALLIAKPDAASLLAGWLGIGRGADAITYLAILAGLFAGCYFYDRYRRLEIVLTELIRRDALHDAKQGSRSENKP
jgi:hypothetical protein